MEHRVGGHYMEHMAGEYYMEHRVDGHNYHMQMVVSLVARMPFLLACSPFIELPPPPPLATRASSQSSDDRACTGDS